MQIFSAEEEQVDRKSFFQKVKQVAVANGVLIFVAAAYAFAILSAPLLIGSLAPAPFSPLTVIPNWASWFDIWITFPALSILCLIPFRGLERKASATIISLVAIIPLYLIFASYYFAYALAPFGFAIFFTPLTLLVPAVALVLLLAAPLVNSVILSKGLSSSSSSYPSTERGDFQEIKKSRLLSSPPFFVAVAVASMALAMIQAYLHYTTTSNGAPLTSWVSDVGIGVEAAARDLLHGVNPYVTGVPPWGGPAPLIWGPVTFLLSTPFSVFLSPGWAAHLSTLFYVVLASIGIWKCMKLFSSRIALFSALLFAALPTTSWLVESGTQLHAIGTVFLVWSLYFFLKRKHFWAGLLSGVGLMAMLIPGALIVPYLLYARGRNNKIRAAAGFFIPTLVSLLGLFLVSQQSFSSLLGTSISGVFNPTGYTLNILLTPSANLAFRIIAIAWLAFWLINRSSKILTDQDLLVTLAIFYLVLPFAAGLYLTFFYIWGSALAIMAIFARLAVSSPPSAFGDNQNGQKEGGISF